MASEQSRASAALAAPQFDLPFAVTADDELPIRADGDRVYLFQIIASV